MKGAMVLVQLTFKVGTVFPPPLLQLAHSSLRDPGLKVVHEEVLAHCQLLALISLTSLR